MWKIKCLSYNLHWTWRVRHEEMLPAVQTNLVPLSSITMLLKEYTKALSLGTAVWLIFFILLLLVISSISRDIFRSGSLTEQMKEKLSPSPRAVLVRLVMLTTGSMEEQVVHNTYLCWDNRLCITVQTRVQYLKTYNLSLVLSNIPLPLSLQCCSLSTHWIRNQHSLKCFFKQPKHMIVQGYSSDR